MVAAHGLSTRAGLLAVERGRYDELVLRDGAFARLARAGEVVEMDASRQDSQIEESARALPRAASA